MICRNEEFFLRGQHCITENIYLTFFKQYFSTFMQPLQLLGAPSPLLMIPQLSLIYNLRFSAKLNNQNQVIKCLTHHRRIDEQLSNHLTFQRSSQREPESWFKSSDC